MIHLALDLSNTIHNLKGLDYLSVKVASDQDTLFSQDLIRKSAYEIYGVIRKEASERFVNSGPINDRVVAFLVKAAKLLNKDIIPHELQAKIAATVVLDESYGRLIKSANDEKTRKKFAEQQAYGREFFLELVSEAI
jgi:hypothetical protein